MSRGDFWEPLIAPEARKERSCQSFSASHIGPRADCPFHRPAFFRPVKNSQRPPQNTHDKGNLIFHSYSKTDVRAPCVFTEIQPFENVKIYKEITHKLQWQTWQKTACWKTKLFNLTRAEKGRAVKRAVRSWSNVWCGERLARALLLRFRCN